MAAVLTIVSIIAATLLGLSNPFNHGSTALGSDQQPSAEACKPTVDTSRLVKVQVSSSNPDLRPVYATPNAPGGNKEEKTWVLVKQSAPIPAWKVQLEHHNFVVDEGKRTTIDPNLGEMERMGTTIAADASNNPDAAGKTAYMGIGWCNPESGTGYKLGNSSSCLDPLVQDAIFVLNNQGATRETVDSFEKINCGNGEPDPNGKPWVMCHEWGEKKIDYPPHNADNVAKYWWTFNVYYDLSKLPPNPTYADLPEWMKLQCPNGGDVYGKNRCETDAICADELSLENSNVVARASSNSHLLGAQTGNSTLGAIIAKSSLKITDTSVQLADTYVSSGKLTEKPAEPPFKQIGTASFKADNLDHFRVLYRKSDVTTEGGADHVLVLAEIGQDEWYQFSPIAKTSKPDAASLQLGSFVPNVPTFGYEWWTPSCKPAIYLYPPKKIALHVQVKPEGAITKSIPLHGTTGWDVIAEPNGSLLSKTDHQPLSLGYLYYEAALDAVKVPQDQGWIRTREELPAFFNTVLLELGLNTQEQHDFLDYWIPKLQEGNTWFITLIDRKELDRVEPIEFSTNPDNFIRVRFYFEKLDDMNINEFSSIAKYEIPNTKYDRQGFTAVDWGGMIGNGSCGIDEKSQ